MTVANTDLVEDPLVVCGAYNKNRFYIFSRRDPDETDDAYAAAL